ncbi:phage recombination protein Bet [Lysinibacillus sp. YS11]|uniref:phage recombination protein Bet n=1 Tax=Lysinibacillus TaxID=400634 RepID=UPI000CA0BC32|nr:MULTISPECIES: phage recombination protein Bet [Lysinibacillus]AUS87832.1 phage recombination protein Bet [Lysinibacillus sp. YS11]MCS1392438.1 phage recombination protein Bet [Lysinibacillus boronitolerans]WBF54877.1 phage recombination protein Bet [Lysinibacillus sp. JK80]
MTNAVMTSPIKFEVNGEEVKLSGNTVMQYLVRGNGSVSEQEVVMFMNLCKFQKLNPFLNEAYLIKFGSSPAQIIVSKEAFMKRAEGHDKYEGFEAGIIVERDGQLVEVEGAVKLDKDKLIGGWCKVYRKDRKVPVITKIDFKEFSKNQATWKDMPMNMIRKSAIVNGLREAFPESLGAMYTEEDKGAQSVEMNVEQEIKQNANTEDLDIKSEDPSLTPEHKEIIDATFEEVFPEEQSDGPGF